MSQTKFAILGMLTLGPMTGYDLKKMSEQSLVHFWQESYGNMYPQLAALEKDGLVSARREQRAGRPDAIVYTLTDRGREEVAAWLERPAAPERRRSELLLKVFFGAQVPIEQTIRQVAAHREEQEAVRAMYAAIEQRIREEKRETASAPFRLMTLRRGQLLTEARLRWCEESLEVLAAMQQQQHAGAC